MFVDHTDHFVFVAVPKTATTAIQTYLNQSSTYATTHPYFTEKRHYSYRWILNDHPDIADYFSFGFTRNPWDRIVSIWTELRDQHKFGEFADFEQFILDFTNTKWAHDIHFQPTTWYLGCATEQVDFIGKYENRGEDFKAVLSKIGRPSFDITARKQSNYDYRQHYTNQRMVEIVGEFYYDDIKNFGYTY